MFNDNSIIKEVNIINKVICYLLVIIALILCKQAIYIMFVSTILLLVTREYTKLFKINILVAVVAILSIFYPQFLWISKIGILVIYTILLKRVTEWTKLRYVLEITLYRFQSKKITYKILYYIDFIKSFKNHFKRMLVLKDDYQIKLDFKFLKFIIKQSYETTKLERNDFLKTYELRFYNNSKSRTYVDKTAWEHWDNNYLFSHILILIITIFYGG